MFDCSELLWLGFWHALWKPWAGGQDWLKYNQVANVDDNDKDDNDKDDNADNYNDDNDKDKNGNDDNEHNYNDDNYDNSDNGEGW